MAFVVIRVERFLDPDQVEVLEHAAHALRSRPVPLLVGVDHQWHVIAEVLADRGDALDVERAVGLPDLQLDAADAALDRGRGIDEQLVEGRVQEAARCVVAGDRITISAEQLGQRQAGALCLQVVERDVEGADRLCRQAAAADRCASPAQLVPQLRDVARILAEQRRARPPWRARTGRGRRPASSS
jgi:hypothetical protein